MDCSLKGGMQVAAKNPILWIGYKGLIHSPEGNIKAKDEPIL